jgi:hypothetical protein
MFELFSDIYFIVYKLYYVGQNNNLDIRVSLKNWDRGSSGDGEYAAVHFRLSTIVTQARWHGLPWAGFWSF